MNYKLYTLYLLFFVMFSMAKGQEVLLTTDKYPEMRFLNLSGNVYYNENQQVKGSAFLIDDWISGDIILKKGGLIKNVSIKLDINSQQVLVYHNLLKRVLIVDKPEIISFILHTPEMDRKFIKLDINRTKSNVMDGIFVEILSEGKISFYKMYYKEKVFLSNPVKPYIFEFIEGKDYKLNYNSQDISVSLKRRWLFKLFPEYKQELKQYIKKNNLKVKTEMGFAKVISYINEIKK